MERKSDRWISITQSVLLHGAVIGALAYGFYTYKQQPRPPTPTLAVEATVVDSKDLKAAPTNVEKPAPAPPPPEPVEDVGPPTPSPEEAQKREQQEREAAEAQQKLEEQRKADEQAEAQERQVAEEKQAAERVAQEKARKEAEEKKRQQEQREAEQKRIADAKRKLEESRKAAEEKRKADEAKASAERQAELRKMLEQEDRAMAVRSSGALQSWLGQIAARIQRAWLRPPSAKPGIDCMVYVTQVPGGEVTNVRVGTCNGDAAVRESIESAVYRASPLPPPPDPSLFERSLEIRFVPTD